MNQRESSLQGWREHADNEAVRLGDGADTVIRVLELLAKLWPLWALVAVVGTAKLVSWLLERQRLKKAGIAEVDRMGGLTFERFLVSFFRRLGYRVEHTGRQGDYGADLVVAKGGRRTAVQAKCWKKKVGVRAVQEVAAGPGFYRCDSALVVANQGFTTQARTLARASTVELWGRDELIAQLAASGGARAVLEAAASETTNGAQRPTCAACGLEVSEAVRDFCRRRPDRFNGLVYCFPHQRFAANNLRG